MKRTIAFIITALILFSTSVYAYYTDVDETMPCYQAVNRLYDFGIMGGYDDNTFRPEKILTRAEATVLVCSALNIQEEDMSYISFYDDVPLEHWASKYITHATAVMAVNGYEDNSFRPDNPVSYLEFMKMMLQILGDTEYCKQNGGYPKGYLLRAEISGMTKLVTSTDYDSSITRGDAAIILNHALEIPLVEITGYEYRPFSPEKFSANTKVRAGTGENYQTLLTKFHKIFKVEGTINSEPLKNSDNDTYNGKAIVKEAIIKALTLDMENNKVNELMSNELCVSSSESNTIKTVQYYAGNDRFYNLIYFKVDNSFLLKYLFKSDPDGNMVHEYDLQKKEEQTK